MAAYIYVDLLPISIRKQRRLKYLKGKDKPPMDPTSPLKADVLRPFATLVVPGAFAVGPWFYVVAQQSTKVMRFWMEDTYVAILLGLVAAIAAGLMLENIGAKLEHAWDGVVDKKCPNQMKRWNNYLKLSGIDDLVGQRYLRTIVLRMKFELAMGPAILIGWTAICALNWTQSLWPVENVYRGALVMLIVVWWLLGESRNSAMLADEVRTLILEAKGCLPPAIVLVESTATTRRQRSA